DLPRLRGRDGLRGRRDEVPERAHHGDVEPDRIHAAGVCDDEVIRDLPRPRSDLPDDQASPAVLSGEGPRATASGRERVDGDVGPSVSDLSSVLNRIIDLQASIARHLLAVRARGSHRAARDGKDEAWDRLVDRLCAGNRIWSAD